MELNYEITFSNLIHKYSLSANLGDTRTVVPHLDIYQIGVE